MPVLILALVLAAPAGQALSPALPGESVCSVTYRTLDSQGREQPARQVSARSTPALVFRGRVSQRLARSPRLLFDVFNPRGQRYQVLVPVRRDSSHVVQGWRTRPRAVEARLAVAGSSIAWTSMYGSWSVRPRFEGQDEPCGPAQEFTILP